MPIYEYMCEHCQHAMEVMQQINDSPLKQCPECKEKALRKIISAVSFRLKGTGWYETDFKNKTEPQKKLQSEDGKTVTGDKADKTSKAVADKADEGTAQNTGDDSDIAGKPGSEGGVAKDAKEAG